MFFSLLKHVVFRMHNVSLTRPYNSALLLSDFITNE